MVFIPEEYYLWDFWLVSPQEWIDKSIPYYLYYLQAPRTLDHHEMRHEVATVGYATSHDLRNWTIKGTAFDVGTPGSWDDRAIWTGSVFVWDGLAYMFYTAKSNAEQGRVQRIGLATSHDLVHWQRHPDNPLIEGDPRWYEPQSTTRAHDQTWRDPFVVYAPDERVHYMFFSARVNTGPHEGRGVVALARSTNLISWEILPPVTTPGEYTEMEVPQVVQLAGRYYLIFCTGRHAVTEPGVPKKIWVGTHYLVADKLTGPYYTLTHEPLLADEPGTYYAGKLVRDSNNTLSFLAWRQWHEDGTFCGGLSNIATVSVLPDGRLHLDRRQLWEEKQARQV